MSLFSNISQKFRSSVDKTIADRKAESSARKKLADIDLDREVSGGVANYKKKGLLDEDARILAKSDVKKKQSKEKWSKVSGALNEAGSNFGSNFGNVGTGYFAVKGKGNDNGWVGNVAKVTRNPSRSTSRRKSSTSSKKPVKTSPPKKKAVVRRRAKPSEPDFNTAFY